MVTWNNHLIGKDTQNMFLALSYGYHIVEGHLCKSIKGDGSPFDIWVQHKLGKRKWHACKSLYWRGFNIPEADFVFHPGAASSGNSDPVQGVDTIFDQDIPHNLTPWINAKLPQSEIQDIDPAVTAPEGLWGLFETLEVSDYSNTGVETDFGYSANAAREVADLILVESKLPNSIIDWGAWKEWRDVLATNTVQDYLDIPNFVGFGLTVKYYNGADFDTFVSERIDAVVYFDSDSGRPAAGLDEIFSARFEGKIIVRFTQTYTFYLYHDDGAKVWINGSLIIDQWGTAGPHSATIALTTAVYYDIKIEWKNTGGHDGIKLEWESTSQLREIVPSECLYPKPQERPLYETHVEFTSPTRLDDAIRKILYLSNSCYQRVNGKYRFFSYDQLSISEATFHLNENLNYFPNTLEKTPRDIRRRNIYKATALDLDSQYLTGFAKPISIERPNLIAQAGRVDGNVLNFETMTRYQVWNLLEKIMRRECDPDWEYQLTGNAETYPVQKDDLVTLDTEFLNEEEKQFLVWKSRDKSSEKTADEREFLLREWI